MVDQRQHTTVVTGAGHLRLMSPPFQGAPFGKGEAQDYKVSSRGQRTRSCGRLNHVGRENKPALGGLILVLLFKLPQSSWYCSDTSEVP